MTIDLLTRVAHLAETTPDKPALVENGETLSYAQLAARSDALAAACLDQGLQPGDVVAHLRGSMTLAYLVALAGMKTGIVFLLLDERDGDDKRRHILSLSAARLLITETERGRALAQDLGLPTLDRAGIDWTRPLPPQPPVAPDAPCWLEPTSGSTSLPKLVQTPRDVLQFYIDAQARAAGLTAQDRIGLFGEVWCDTLFAALGSGGTLCAYNLREQGTAGIAHWMRSHRITAMQTYVAAFRALAEATDQPLPDLRLVRLAGEPVLPADVAAFERLTRPGAELGNYYGSTECGFITEHRHRHGDPVTGDSLPIGRAVIPGSEVVLVDEYDRPVPQGAIGRLLFRVPRLPAGYLGNPDKTAEVYRTAPDGRPELNPGDTAVADENGLLRIAGRIDDQVKIRGYSVRYSEVETAMAGHPALAGVAVTSVLSPRGQRLLTAHYMLRDGAQATGTELRDWLKTRLPAYMVPNYYTAHDSFPRTDTGKVLRRALPNPLDNLAEQTRGTAGLGALETLVATTWEQVLGHGAFGPDDDFFDVGGDSLQAMAMVVALERETRRRIGYETLIMDGATVRAIARRLEADPAAGAPIVTLKPGDDGQTVYVLPVENGEFSDWLYMLRALDPGTRMLGVHVRDQSDRSAFARRSVQDLAAHAAQAIRAHDPEGPYLVAGFSAGTQLAYETAALLKTSGKGLAGLILIDPPVLSHEPLRRTWHIRRILSPVFKDRDPALGLERAGHILLGRPTTELHIADETAFWRWRPRPQEIAPALMVSATDLNPERAAKEAEWARLLGRPPEIAEAPGDHITVMREPNSDHVARIVQRWLNRIRPPARLPEEPLPAPTRAARRAVGR